MRSFRFVYFSCQAEDFDMSDESVYGLIQPEAAPHTKAPRFKSHAAPAPTASTFGFHGTSVVMGNVAGQGNLNSVHPSQKAFATFGRNVAEAVDPKAFLKKSTSTKEASTKSADACPLHHDKRKAPIPKRDEKPVMGLKTDKNFVVSNAVENILSIAKKQSQNGSARAVDRDDYGKVPTYIHSIKAELKDQYALVDSYKQRKAQEQEKFTELNAVEIQELRSGLQRRWEALNKEFQTMGFSVETYSQKRHQEEVEAELRSVEAALQRVGKQRIFVFDDTK